MLKKKRSGAGEKMHRVNVIPTKIPWDFFFVKIDKLILKFIWKRKRLRTAKNNYKRKPKVEGVRVWI
jgi:hypothetical protein